MSKVNVRVAVAVDPAGNWSAYGNIGEDDQDMMNIAVDSVDCCGERRYFLTAALEIPPEDVAAEVEEAK